MCVFPSVYAVTRGKTGLHTVIHTVQMNMKVFYSERILTRFSRSEILYVAF